MPDTAATSVALDDLPAMAGKDLGVSRWVTRSARTTSTGSPMLSGDKQWIHIDPERARNRPFGGTVAHGFFTLSLATDCSSTSWTSTTRPRSSTTASTGCGSRRPRRPAARCGSARVASVDEVPGGYQVASG